MLQVEYSKVLLYTIAPSNNKNNATGHRGIAEPPAAIIYTMGFRFYITTLANRIVPVPGSKDERYSSSNTKKIQPHHTPPLEQTPQL